MRTEPTDKCANPNCHCVAKMESNYCSEYCEFHADETETGCQCGHPDCQSLRVMAFTEMTPSDRCFVEE